MTENSDPPIWIDDSGDLHYICLRAEGEPFRIELGAWHSDALGGLLRATLAIATGDLDANASYDQEPLEERLILARRFDSKAWLWKFDVQVLEFDDALARRPRAEGREKFRTECDPDEFARAVADACNAYWLKHGPHEFIGHGPPTGFPLKALRALETALATAEPPSQPPPRHATFTRVV